MPLQLLAALLDELGVAGPSGDQQPDGSEQAEVEELVERVLVVGHGLPFGDQTQSAHSCRSVVGQLCGVLHQEARLADELARSLGLDAVDRITPVVDLQLLFVLVGLVVSRDHPILEDRVEVGLDVVGRDEVLVLVLVLHDGCGWPPAAGRGLGILLGFLFLVLEIGDLVVVAEAGELVVLLEDVLVEVLDVDVGVVEVCFDLLEPLLEVLHFHDLFVCHRHRLLTGGLLARRDHRAGEAEGHLGSL